MSLQVRPTPLELCLVPLQVGPALLELGLALPELSLAQLQVGSPLLEPGLALPELGLVQPEVGPGLLEPGSTPLELAPLPIDVRPVGRRSHGDGFGPCLGLPVTGARVDVHTDDGRNRLPRSTGCAPPPPRLSLLRVVCHASPEGSAAAPPAAIPRLEVRL
jgi:hypothetical protein